MSSDFDLSEYTVKNHLFHIFDKLGISDRVELVLYAVSNPRRDVIPSSQKDDAIASLIAVGAIRTNRFSPVPNRLFRHIRD